MIPKQKKTPEELAALREELGFFQNPEVKKTSIDHEPTAFPFKKVIGKAPPSRKSSEQITREPVKPKKRKIKTLRKFELPLFPATDVVKKTPLPGSRRSQDDLAELQRREALASFSTTPPDPLAQLKKLVAHPVLLILAYLPAFGAIYTASHSYLFITPISLICVSGLLTAYIFWRKKRSRHHAALLIIILAMTLVFGGIHYAPYFTAYAS
ncbi:MAG: hypothetical protein ACK40T_07435 [Akkermansiaceae bacterium]|jgi:hypothetical protein